MLGELINYLCLKEKVGAILESIVKNHPFLDGTKRTGYVLMRTLIFDIFGVTGNYF
ncbi:Fic family protein [Cecembia lonarensis]|uniref:Fic family protein n=1 Tax=Cecembia lonarensis TaxID=645110 RepID=UPI0002D5429E|nr:Fic family protein [Cecembia lonarensis]